LPTNDAFDMGWMVAKNDLDLNEEFFAVRKQNLSNQEKLNLMRRAMQGWAIADPSMPTSQPSLRERQEVGMPALGETGETMTAEEYAKLIGIDESRSAPRPAPPPEEAEPEPEEEAEVEIVDEEPEPVEEPGPDDALEDAPEPDPEVKVGEADEVFADIPETSVSPKKVEPEDFVESSEPLDTEGVFIDAYTKEGEQITGGMPIDAALEADGKGGYLHTLGDGTREFYFGMTREEYDALGSDNLESSDWSVIENPFANPFFDTSAFAIRKDRPRGFVSPVPLSPIDEIQKEQKPPELDGFQTKEGDDLSLLPSSTLLKNNSVGDDLSLLPVGWKDD